MLAALLSAAFWLFVIGLGIGFVLWVLFGLLFVLVKSIEAVDNAGNAVNRKLDTWIASALKVTPKSQRELIP